MKILHLHALEGYNAALESARATEYRIMLTSTDKDTQRQAVSRLAWLTALRSPAFVAAMNRLLNLQVDDE